MSKIIACDWCGQVINPEEGRVALSALCVGGDAWLSALAFGHHRDYHAECFPQIHAAIDNAHQAQEAA